jgi:PHS family inorganic phosphate transporter-like MFS transporter
MMGAVFAMQGFGQLAAAVVALIVTAGFKESLQTAKDVSHCTGVCQLAVDKMWRVVIGFGAVPACFALYYRLTIPETPRFTFDVAHDLAKADEDVRAYLKGLSEGHPDEVQRINYMRNDAIEFRPKASWSDFWRHYSQWKHGKVLFGTAASWFFLDVGMFSNSSTLPVELTFLQPSTVLV